MAIQLKIKTIDTPAIMHKQHKEHKEHKQHSYTVTLSQTTKTVAQLYDAYQNYFPVEYSLLLNPVRIPNGNGNILRFSKNPINGYVMVARPNPSKGQRTEFTEDELADLSNCRVFLEPNQTELSYIDRWFKYVIVERGITNYRLRQMYWMSKLNDESEDDLADPDYIPEEDSEAEDDIDEYQSEDEEDSEDDEDSEDEDKSPDYTPSVESEEEDSEDSEGDEDSEDSEDEDKSPDYTPSVESEEEESDDDYDDIVNKYKLLKQKLKEQHQKQVSRKSQKTRSH